MYILGISCYFQERGSRALEEGKLVLDNSFRDSSDYKFKKSNSGGGFCYSVNHSRVLQVVNKKQAGYSDGFVLRSPYWLRPGS